MALLLCRILWPFGILMFRFVNCPHIYFQITSYLWKNEGDNSITCELQTTVVGVGNWNTDSSGQQRYQIHLFCPILLCNGSYCLLFVPCYGNNMTHMWEQEHLSFTFPHSLCVDKGKCIISRYWRTAVLFYLHFLGTAWGLIGRWKQSLRN